MSEGAIESSTPAEKEVNPWPEILLIAHRGASERYTENTLVAFRAAIEKGANMVELDVWRTGDGQLAVCHDHKIGDEDVREITLARARELNPHLCSLSEVIEFLERKGVSRWVGLYVEIKDKDPRATQLVIDYLKSREIEGRTIVGSFSEKAVRNLAQLKGEGKTEAKISWLLYSPVTTAVLRGEEWGIDYLHPWHPFFRPLDKKFIEGAHAAGLKVISGHTEDLGQIQELKKMDIDGICSNRPGLFV